MNVIIAQIDYIENAFLRLGVNIGDLERLLEKKIVIRKKDQRIYVQPFIYKNIRVEEEFRVIPNNFLVIDGNGVISSFSQEEYKDVALAIKSKLEKTLMEFTEQLENYFKDEISYHKRDLINSLNNEISKRINRAKVDNMVYTLQDFLIKNKLDEITATIDKASITINKKDLKCLNKVDDEL